MDRNLSYTQYIYKKKKRRRLLTAMTIVFFVLVAAGLIAVAAFTLLRPRLEPVQNTYITDTTTSSVKLRWNKVENADGYLLYSGKNAKKLKKTADTAKNEYTVKNLEQASRYYFYVIAYNDYTESPSHTNVTALTLPEKPKITLARSRTEGMMDVEWKENKNASSYTLQYKTMYQTDYSEGKSLSVKADSDCSATFDDLIPGAVYDVRVRAVVKDGSDKLCSSWDKKQVTIFKEPEPEPEYDSDKPMIALTFDDGPGYGNAGDKILDVLEKYKAKATFFMIGENTLVHPENVLRKKALGMELGNHTWNHSNYEENVTADDIRQASDSIVSLTGEPPTAFRSPGGMTTENIRKECEKENLPLYYWSIDTEDWSNRNAKTIYKKVLKNVQDGDIILMHEIYDSTAKAVEKLVPKLVKKGYQLVTCRELIRVKYGIEPQPGVQYYSGR